MHSCKLSGVGFEYRQFCIVKAAVAIVDLLNTSYLGRVAPLCRQGFFAKQCQRRIFVMFELRFFLTQQLQKIFSAILRNFNLLTVTQNHFSYCKFNRFREKLVLFSECLVILYREKIAIFGNVYMILEKILKIFSKEKKILKNN